MYFCMCYNGEKPKNKNRIKLANSPGKQKTFAFRVLLQAIKMIAVLFYL